MTSHELGQKLLSLPNKPIFIEGSISQSLAVVIEAAVCSCGAEILIMQETNELYTMKPARCQAELDYCKLKEHPELLDGYSDPVGYMHRLKSYIERGI